MYLVSCNLYLVTWLFAIMKYDFLTIGDAFEDVFILPTELKVREDRSFLGGLGVSFELGEKIPLKEVDYEIGGSACNASVGFSRLGLSASLVTVLGDDTPAEKIRKRLEDELIDTSSILTDKSIKTNFSIIFRFNQGRTIFIYHGLKDYSSLGIKKSIKAKWIFLAPIGENTEDLERDIITKVAEENTKLAWNPGAIQIRKGVGHFQNLLKNTSVLILNREEAIKFIHYPVKPEEETVIKRLHSLGPQIVVMTNGKKGAIAYDGKLFYRIRALEGIVRVDSTGAGDSFAVGFLSKLFLNDWSGGENPELISEALRWGIFNSNSVVQYVGAQKGLLSLNKIEKESKEHKRLSIEIK